MKILGIIPARGGSKGVPGKNIKELGGKPLLEYTWNSVLETRSLTRVILSTDDPEIISVGEKLGIEVPFVRPKFLAGDDASSIDVVYHALKFFEDKGSYFDAICLLQPTSPLRQKNLIDKAIHKFILEEWDSLISVREVPLEFNPHWTFEDINGILKITTGEKEIIKRRQDLPKTFFRDGAIYLTKSEIVKGKKSLYGDSIGYIDTSASTYVNIDSEEDWDKAERILVDKKKYIE